MCNGLAPRLGIINLSTEAVVVLLLAASVGCVAVNFLLFGPKAAG